MRRGAKIGIITGVSVAVLAGGGYGAYSLVGSGGSDTAEAKKARTVVAEPPSAEQAAAGAKDFLEAWAAGDIAKAAGLTDDPAAATAALTAFKDQVKPSALTLAPSGPATPAAFASATGTPSPGAKPAAATGSAAPTAAGTESPSASASAAPSGVLMGFKARAEFEGTNRVWDYNGFLGVVKMSDNTPAVHWAPSVIHPHLTAGEVIATQPVFAPAGNVVDRNGKALQGASITPALISTLQDNARKLLQADPTKDQSDAGSGVVITDAASTRASPTSCSPSSSRSRPSRSRSPSTTPCRPPPRRRWRTWAASRARSWPSSRAPARCWPSPTRLPPARTGPSSACWPRARR